MLKWRNVYGRYLPLLPVAYQLYPVYKTTSGIKKPTGKEAVVNHIVVPEMVKRDLKTKGFLQLLQGVCIFA